MAPSNQSDEPIFVATNPIPLVDGAHSHQSQAEAETPASKTTSSASHPDGDENLEKSAVVPEKLPSPEGSESEVMDEPATMPDVASLGKFN